jgi:hypothetical protein
MVNFPEQMVNSKGQISMPFVGAVQAGGRRSHDIEEEIAARLQGKANQPQVLVRTIQNNTANVTLVGDVTTSSRVPLSARGERLLDALAAGGGVKQSVDRTTVQVARGTKVRALPLEIRLEPTPRVAFTTLRGKKLVCTYGAAPVVDGATFDYSGWKLFSGPYLNAEVGSGKLTITHGALERVLDFNTVTITDRVKP